MPSLKDVKRRIGSIKNTQKITHAMKLVSAAKFARANQSVVAARPYGISFDEMCSKVLENSKGVFETDLAKERGQFGTRALVVVSSDRGLCGSLNANLFKAVAKHVKELESSGIKVIVYNWGRRATSFGKKAKFNVQGEKERVVEKPKYNSAKILAGELVKIFEEAQVDAIDVSYMKFKSALTQTPVVTQILPLVKTAKKDPNSSESAEQLSELPVLLEPSPKSFASALVRRQIEGSIYRLLLESSASEHGARMTAMDSATRNAKEVIRKLTLQYNRGRQAAITKELIEITSGAEAL
jgi:F-type H+-transporting ATPase subunit gamma